jgi:hypothetical protein
MAVYQRIKRITIPLGVGESDEDGDGYYLVYITTEIGANHSNIIKSIGQIKTRNLLL